MSKEKEDEIELLGQGSYGCVYKPGILCNGKTATKKYITKVQEKDISTQNEIEIGKKIMKIPNYSRYFSPILETCPLNLSHIDDKEMDKCLIYEKGTQFITNKMKYVGETKRILKFRLADHRGYVNNHDYKTATGEHFNSPGHSLADLTLSITILKKLKRMMTFIAKKGRNISLKNSTHSL